MKKLVAIVYITALLVTGFLVGDMLATEKFEYYESDSRSYHYVFVEQTMLSTTTYEFISSK